MKTHSVTAYTLEKGDKLYYVKDGKVKKIVVKQENLEDTKLTKSLDKDLRDRCNDLMIKPLIDDIYIKPGEKVKQSKNGRLILWKKRAVKECENHEKILTRYEEVETNIAISADLLDLDISVDLLIQSSELFKDVKIVVLYFKDTHRQVGAMSVADFLTLHPNDAKNMLENQGIEAVAVNFDGSTQNFDPLLRVMANRSQ